MHAHLALFAVLVLSLGPVLSEVAALDRLDRLDRPVPPDLLEKCTEDMLAGRNLRFGLYGLKPVEWIENATGDEMLRWTKSGKFPADDSLEHTNFIYGSHWVIGRGYYMAYRATGDPRFAEQLRQCARVVSWMLENRPWLILPKARRGERPADWVAALPYDAASSAMFQAHTLSARLTFQAARDDRSSVTDAQLAEARQFLQTVTRYMDSQVRGDGAIDEASGLPAVAAGIINTVPYNQSFMYYGILAVTAAALEDQQHLEGHTRHQRTIDLYTRIVRGGVDCFVRRNDVTEIGGRPYVFRSYAPTDPLMQVRDRETRERVPLVVGGHPVFRYPEDFAHAQSAAWYLVLLAETGKQFGVTTALLQGIANTQVDHQLRGRAALKDGTTGPPNKILSPWAVTARPGETWDRLGKAQPVYAIYLPYHPGIAQASRDFNPRGEKEINGPEGTLYLLYAHYLHALRKAPGLPYLPKPGETSR